MKNLRYFPFERNLFFKGKLLTVRDFESEQKYFNDKRRMINRLLHGSGVVSGLQVIRVDDKQISLETGMALDCLGREIVVASPVKMKLSMIDGFKNNEYAKNVYLCIAYDEKGKEQVYSVNNNASSSDEQSEYNRVMESYKMFIKEEAPDPASFENSNQYESICLIYDDTQVRIWQKTPLYINPGDTFELVLHVEKTVQTAKIDFEYALDSVHFTLESDEGKISFSEPLDGQSTDYEVSFMLRAGSTPGKADLTIKSDSAKLSIGDKLLHIASKQGTNSIEIITGPVKDRILADYYSRTMDKSVEFTSDQCIYLAKICLLQMGSTYMIEKIDPVPFGEYIYNASILNKLAGMGENGKAVKASFRAKSTTVELKANENPQFSVRFDEDSQLFDFKLALPKTQKISNDVTVGYVDIPLKAKGGIKPFSKPEKSFFSDEIDHFLGDGHVFIVTGLEELSGDPISGMLNRSEQVFFGDNDVFKDTQFESEINNVAIGTLLYPKKGTFRIGVKPQNNSFTGSVRVHWWAFKQLADPFEAHIGKSQDNTMDKAQMEAAASSEEVDS